MSLAIRSIERWYLTFQKYRIRISPTDSVTEHAIFWWEGSKISARYTVSEFLAPSTGRLLTLCKWFSKNQRKVKLLKFYSWCTFDYLTSTAIFNVLVWFTWVRLGSVIRHINYCRLFNAKSGLYMYIKYIGFGLTGFYGISTIVGYLMPNPVHTCILNI